jgi:hypothetical protein
MNEKGHSVCDGNDDVKQTELNTVRLKGYYFRIEDL